MRNRILVILSVILCTIFLCSAVHADEKAADYLHEYYGVTFEGEVTKEAYNAALIAMGAEGVDCEILTLADAVVGAVRLAGLEELALTYVNEKAPQKAAAILADEHITVDDKFVPYVACALELGLVSDNNDFSGSVNAETVISMLYRAAEIAGKGRHYIGRLSDDDILTKAQSVMTSDLIFSEDVLDTVGINILVEDASTGYSLKYNPDNARFLEKFTIRYGHDNIIHLVQLIGLLKSEDYDAYVQIERKVSVYEYMLEWGLPKAPTPTYVVKEMLPDRYFAFALEYELVLEFDTSEKKEEFHELIEAYAKKYDDRVDADGNIIKELLYQSFWQPLYYSLTEMENKEYEVLTDNVIFNADGDFSIHSISVADKAEAVALAVADVAPELKVERETIYANPAFYRYLTGIDYQ